MEDNVRLCKFGQHDIASMPREHEWTGGRGTSNAGRAPAVEKSVAEETITSILGAVLTILCGCGAEDKRKATGRILPYGILQVESLKRNMATRSVRGDVFEVSFGNPVVGCGVTTAVVQHQ